MELMSGRYEFVFPHSGSPLPAKTQVYDGFKSANDHKYGVMLGLLPEVKRKFSVVREGEMQDWIVISHPRFVAISR
jgi:hypothetical protein